MRVKFISLSILFFVCEMCFAQLRIEDCYQKARVNYPLIRQFELIEKARDYNLSNANKGYLPQVMFSAKATYQSDVTQLPIDFSQLGMSGVNIPTLSRDQYGATLDVNQIIWDGGAIKHQKLGVRAAAEVDKMSVEVSIYAINERINQIYFGVLLVDAQIVQNQLFQDELKRSFERVYSYIQNGIANQSDLDAIKIEQLKAMQTKA